MVIVIAVRLHEFVPALMVFQPVLITTFGGFAILLAKAPADLRSSVFRHPLPRLAVAYLTVAIITVPLSLWPGQAFGAIKSFFPAVVLLVGLQLCAPTLINLHRLQVALISATMLYALYANVKGTTIAEGRIAAGVGMYDSNDMAALMALTFPLAVGLARRSTGRTRGVAALAGVVLIATVVASGSRGGVLALGTGAIVFALGMRGAKRAMMPAFLLAVALLVWNVAPEAFREQMRTLTHLEEDYNMQVESGRKAVWERGRQYFLDNPVLGVGVGNFPIAEGDFFKAQYHGTRGAKWSAAHNAYVQVFAELGLVGGGLFVGLLAYGVSRSWRFWRGGVLTKADRWHQPELLASLCGFMVGAIFLSHAYFFPLFALLGLVAFADRVATLETEAGTDGLLNAVRSKTRRRRGGGWTAENPQIGPRLQVGRS